MVVRGRFFRRLFIAYMSIVLIYTLISVGVLFYKNYEINQMQANNRSIIFVEQVQEQIDTKVQIGFNQIKKLIANEHVQQYANSRWKTNVPRLDFKRKQTCNESVR